MWKEFLTSGRNRITTQSTHSQRKSGHSSVERSSLEINLSDLDIDSDKKSESM